MKTDSVIAILERMVAEVGSQKALAEKLGCSLPYLNDVLLRRKEPGRRILEPLKLRRVISYEREE